MYIDGGTIYTMASLIISNLLFYQPNSTAFKSLTIFFHYFLKKTLRIVWLPFFKTVIFFLINTENNKNVFGSHHNLCFEKDREHQNLIFYDNTKMMFSMFLKTIFYNSFKKWKPNIP